MWQIFPKSEKKKANFRKQKTDALRNIYEQKCKLWFDKMRIKKVFNMRENTNTAYKKIEIHRTP